MQGLVRAQVRYADRKSAKADDALLPVPDVRDETVARFAIWLYDRMLWPGGNDAPDANPDLPDDIVRDYLEAGSILAASPRGAAALLRLCLQKLCAHVLGSAAGKTIDQDIGTLVARGLDQRIQQA